MFIARSFHSPTLILLRCRKSSRAAPDLFHVDLPRRPVPKRNPLPPRDCFRTFIQLGAVRSPIRASFTKNSSM
jgi:hypothetical protein